MCYGTLANAAGARRNYVRAKELEHTLLGIYEKRGRPKDLIRVLRKHAVVLLRLGERTEAVNLGERGVAVARANFPEESREVAMAMESLGDVHRASGDSGVAEPLLVKSLEILDRVLGHSHGDVASAANNLGAFYHYTKRDLAKAEPLYQRALEQRRRYVSPRSSNLGQVLLNLGALRCERGEWEEGRALFNEGAAIMEKNGGEENVELRRSRAWLKRVEASAGLR